MTRDQYIASLAAERRRRGLSQAALAVRIGEHGVAQQSLSSWESGAVSPDRHSLAAWAEALHVEPYPEAVEPVRPECGTRKGYGIHRRLGEPKCDPCKDANAIYMTIYRTARRSERAA